MNPLEISRREFSAKDFRGIYQHIYDRAVNRMGIDKDKVKRVLNSMKIIFDPEFTVEHPNVNANYGHERNLATIGIPWSLVVRLLKQKGRIDKGDLNSYLYRTGNIITSIVHEITHGMQLPVSKEYKGGKSPMYSKQPIEMAAKIEEMNYAKNVMGWSKEEYLSRMADDTVRDELMKRKIDVTKMSNPKERKRAIKIIQKEFLPTTKAWKSLQEVMGATEEEWVKMCSSPEAYKYFVDNIVGNTRNLYEMEYKKYMEDIRSLIDPKPWGLKDYIKAFKRRKVNSILSAWWDDIKTQKSPKRLEPLKDIWMSTVSNLVKIADELDLLGFTKQAEVIDDVIKQM